MKRNLAKIEKEVFQDLYERTERQRQNIKMAVGLVKNENTGLQHDKNESVTF